MSNKHLVNPELQAMAWMAVANNAGRLAKAAFVPAGDPSMDPTAAAAGGGAPGGPPPGAGGPPGGPPPPDAGGGPPPIDPNAIAQQVLQMVQAQGGGMGGAGGMGGGMVEPIKPKIDVNVEIMQMKKMMAKLCDAMGIVIPASDMAVNSQDLTQMAMQQGGQGGGGGGQQQSAIPPIQPMGAAMPGGGGMGGGMKTSYDRFNNGTAFDASTTVGFEDKGQFDTNGLSKLASRAAAIATIRKLRKTA